jgi:hypothetical protein
LIAVGAQRDAQQFPQLIIVLNNQDGTAMIGQRLQ